jgi:VWFA-related protein
MTIAAPLAPIIALCFCLHTTTTAAQASQTQSNPQSNQGQTQGQQQDVPDAPSAVQPAAKLPQPAPPPEQNPTTQPPTAQPGAENGVPSFPTSEPGSEEPLSPPPPMPPITTAPPGSVPKQPSGGQEQIYKLSLSVNFVQVPVTVKYPDGRPVDGLLPKDFTVLENGKPQKLTFFTSDPFALSVAVVLDLGMPDVAVQKVNQTYPSLIGAFSPYDEVAVYTYSSTVSQVSDFGGPTQRLTAVLNQMKTVRGHNNGPPVLSGPMASGPVVNGIPVGGPPVVPVNTPPKEAHVLNDAILRAALDLSKRDKARRKVIFVISDGKEYGSTASYGDVKRLLLAQGIQVKAVALDSAALPVYSKIERLHLPRMGYSDILPKYVSATGGGQVFSELSRNAIEEAYAQITSEARNQYTLGYSAPKAGPAYRDIEVKVQRPGLKIYAKDGYYPVPAGR